MYFKDAFELSERVETWVASATSAIPYICVQFHTSTAQSACYMNMATLMRCWEKPRVTWV